MFVSTLEKDLIYELYGRGPTSQKETGEGGVFNDPGFGSDDMHSGRSALNAHRRLGAWHEARGFSSERKHGSRATLPLVNETTFSFGRVSLTADFALRTCVLDLRGRWGESGGTAGQTGAHPYPRCR